MFLLSDDGEEDEAYGKEVGDDGDEMKMVMVALMMLMSIELKMMIMVVMTKMKMLIMFCQLSQIVLVTWENVVRRESKQKTDVTQTSK